ncbi:hypothetical protein NT6N_23880 [Oceaniferula spumae]|uniref:Uncharacterized protein n=1 Tax=Oceaniferula spumae TaxID=2979115 RepID=A0AAT9FN26_9BACT
MTKGDVIHNMLHPYNPIKDTAVVTLMKYSSENEFIQIHGPNENISLRHLGDGTWEVADPINANEGLPHVGRMFEERTK